MGKCKVCANADNEYCFACDNGNQFKPITNADRIRSMTDEELAYFMANIEPCRESAWLDWLKQEVSDNA
jgi:hypothetical protein